MTTVTARQSAASTTTRGRDATALLRADHKHVSELFSDYEKARSPSRKKDLVAQICSELSVHAQVEEELFYPSVRGVLKDRELVPEATVEHASIRDLIAQIEGVDPDGDLFDAKVMVLSEYVKHHVKEEQNELFPQVKDSNLDLFELGARIAARKAELLGEKRGGK